MSGGVPGGVIAAHVALRGRRVYQDGDDAT
jgi:hypothetical protein